VSREKPKERERERKNRSFGEGVTDGVAREKKKEVRQK
jgi:hypothetical protein